MPEKTNLLLTAISVWVRITIISIFCMFFIAMFILDVFGDPHDEDVFFILMGSIALVGSTLITIWQIIGLRKKEAQEAAEHEKAEAQRKADAAVKEKAKKAKEEAKRKKIKELNEKYGEPFGTSVYNHKVVKGMSVDAVEESWGKPNLIKNDSWYYPAKRRKILSQITFKNNKVSNIEEKDQLVELNMSKKEVIAIWGEPEDEKETVYKTKTKLRLYYFPRTTRQHTTVYGYEVRLEDDVVVGWKEFD